MSETYWIIRREQVEALASSVRMDICDRLAALGPMTVRELSDALGRQPTSIYHHLKDMIDVGLVKSSEKVGARGRPGMVYETVAPRMRAARAIEFEENHDAIARGARVVANTMAKEYAEAIGQEESTPFGAARNHWLFRVVAAPSAERLARINTLLDELAELVWTPDPKPGPLISIGWFLSPLKKRPHDRHNRDE